jgi:hypothetical protein
MTSLQIEEALEKEIWEMLKQLKIDLILTPDDEYVIYEVMKRETSNYPSPENQRKILNKLQSLEAIKIVRKNYLSVNNELSLSGNAFEMQGLKPRWFFLKIIDDKFNPLFQDYGQKYSHGDTEEIVDLYVKKIGDAFYYNGALIQSSYKNDAFRVFSVLYDLMENGGTISYEELGKSIKNTISKTKSFSQTQMQKFIQLNLTDKTNGFIERANLKSIESNGKPLLEIERGYGIIFNNKKL